MHLLRRITEKILRIRIVVKESFVKGIAEKALYGEVMNNETIGASVKKQPKIDCPNQYHSNTVLTQPRNVQVLIIGVIVAAPLQIVFLITPCQSEQECEICNDGEDHHKAVSDIELPDVFHELIHIAQVQRFLAEKKQDNIVQECY